MLELISYVDPECPCCWHPSAAIYIRQEIEHSGSDFIPRIDSGGLGIRAGSGDGAHVTCFDRHPWGRRECGIGIDQSALQVSCAIVASPIRVVIAADAEVGATHDFEVVGQTRMANGKIPLGKIDLSLANQSV